MRQAPDTIAYGVCDVKLKHEAKSVCRVASRRWEEGLDRFHEYPAAWQEQIGHGNSNQLRPYLLVLPLDIRQMQHLNTVSWSPRVSSTAQQESAANLQVWQRDTELSAGQPIPPLGSSSESRCNSHGWNQLYEAFGSCRWSESLPAGSQKGQLVFLAMGLLPNRRCEWVGVHFPTHALPKHVQSDNSCWTAQQM